MTKNSSASSRIIYADFEESGNTDEQIWSHYLEHNFVEDIAGKKDRFTLDTESPFMGSFSVRSMDPNGHILNDNDTDSFFVVDPDDIFGRDMTYGDELMIRYAARFPVDWEGEATDTNGGANHLRLNGLSGTGIEATFGGGWSNNGSWFYWYGNTPPNWFSGVFLKDDQWHQYTVYIKAPSSNSSSDGIIRIWRDNNGEYLTSDALFNRENFTQSGDFTRIAVATPCYYKGPVSAVNWTFWLDNVEVWDGLPDAPATDTTPPSAPSGLSVQ